MTATFTLHTFSEADILANLAPLSDVLSNCVNGGASVSFMQPFKPETALAFWQRMAASVGREERVVLVA